MAAEAPWTGRVRERAFEAEGLCDHARGMLCGAAAHLELLMDVADAQGGRSRAELVAVELFSANIGFASAAATMAAAELLARRRAATGPTAPLPSVDDIPMDHAFERSALGMLQEARVYAEGAYDTVGSCCDRLLTAYNLLDHLGLPGVDGFVDAERDAAHGYLVVAENLAGVSAAYSYTALCLLFRD
ncbi:hypothetical protein PAHAL_5G479700 [Panicum hallii]|jgi:hypothetical protein|uniref:Pectinesterase inhibitor domain-containing protein n=1 Tax=Panicum hallii TaxID=206008 RepID=A0A2S3HXX6_9POAL|nr:hypothetical protein PAHAL_5G479700 [Panicum hallii]